MPNSSHLNLHLLIKNFTKIGSMLTDLKVLKRELLIEDIQVLLGFLHFVRKR